MASPEARLESASKERFFRYFQHEVIALQDQMSRLASASPTERPDAIDHCLANIARLASEVKDASSYIPAYDQRTYGDAIKALSEKLQNTRNELGAGPKKFKFTTKKNKSAISIGEAAEMVQNRRLLGPGGGAWDSSVPSSAAGSAFAPTPLEKLSPGEEKREQELLEQEKALADVRISGAQGDGQGDGQGVTVSNEEGSYFVLPAGTAHSASSGVVSNVRRSVVDLSGSATGGAPFATLTLKDVQESLVLCGHVTGPIHITSVENSVIVISCRQFRMHSSKNVDVYLHCSSRPIIEDCEQIRFAPLPQNFMTEELSTSTNQWNQIDDFKWLKAEPSPHFSIVPESKRIQEATWRDQVSGKDSANLSDILHAVGVSILS